MLEGMNTQENARAEEVGESVVLLHDLDSSCVGDFGVFRHFYAVVPRPSQFYVSGSQMAGWTSRTTSPLHPARIAHID